MEEYCKGRLIVNREFGITGIDGAKRRTDLELVFGNRRAIVVEVKKGSADIIDVRQLQDQLQHRQGFDHYILLATSAANKVYGGGFYVLTWEEVCIRLRHIVQQRHFKSAVQTAMILAFVGAVEQNILGLPGNFARRYRYNEVISSSLRYRIQTYLEKTHL